MSTRGRRLIGPGGNVPGTCTPVGVVGTGYTAILTVTCDFDDVEVNTYSVAVDVFGGYYVGFGEDVVTIFDPSLGFTTGGGWFYWPGTDDPTTGYPGDRTNIGFNVKYKRRNNGAQGGLLLVRRLADGSVYRIKSNAIEGLAVGEDVDVAGDRFGWASFSGKATYVEPGWPEPIGNHKFVAYVEDHGTPGGGVDRFWIEVVDRDGIVISVSSMDRDAVPNAVLIQGGNIVVPHRTSKKNGR